jgi:endonuclease YncB( thermonuclease family)
MTIIHPFSTEAARARRRARATQFALGGLALAFGIVFAVLVRAETVDGRRALIIDGDTVAIDGERIRIFNIDAPESRGARCDAELVAGLREKERLAQLLRAGEVSIRRCDGQRCRDPYGRTLARLEAGGRDVGEVLVREGLALPWASGPGARQARVIYWCGSGR